ncbi:MAG: diphosphomevalonate decarboxylase [Candidatus Woesebacteria bacterium]|nr:diphosphomevalonate decarboxylase [Candidatus Woesebacteria bacterium]
MKITVKAPANIAFIKYWGKRDEKLRIPANSSISMNLSNAFSITSVDFDEKLKGDIVKIDGVLSAGSEKDRVARHLSLVRKISGKSYYAEVVSKNNFPKASGIASSASGFAALTLAASLSAGLMLSEKDLSIIARLGSGSACRSIPDGFVEWRQGSRSEDSYAYGLYPADYWNICDVIAIIGQTSKKVSSTKGHTLSESSPFYKARILGMAPKIREIKLALKNKDFTKFGDILEAEAINMHTVMMTSSPALYYWVPKTLEIILKVIEWRSQGLEVYFTIDAGPNVHIICEEKNVINLKSNLLKLGGVKEILINRPAVGARVINLP